jgi:hypothetical protein
MVVVVCVWWWYAWMVADVAELLSNEVVKFLELEREGEGEGRSD